MNKFGLTVAAIAALGLGACQSGSKGNNSATANNSASANDTTTVNGAAIGTAAENGVQDARNVAGNAGDRIENALNQAGSAIENTGRAAVNGVRNATDGDGQANTSTNKTGR